MSDWPICDKCGTNVLEPEYRAEYQQQLEAENQRLRERLTVEQRRSTTAEQALHMAAGDCARLRAEMARTVEYLDPASRSLLSELAQLRSGIEKLRDECLQGSGRLLSGPFSGWVARRLTELLGDET